MIAAGRHSHGCKMPCESCAVQFSVFKRKRACCECERYYCSGCLRRGGGAMCAPCRVLSTRPLHRTTIAHLKVRDLQCFLQRQNVSTRGCVEKEELVTLCVSHVNGAAYRRRGGGGGGARSSGGAFSSLKGFTNNINDFLNNAFDLRPAATPAPAPTPRPAPAPPYYQQTRDCFNSSHAHRSPSPAGSEESPSRPHSERFTTTPGGERDIEVPVPPAAVERTPSVDSTRVDTADCFEIEDLDDAGWEFVTRPAEPLPNDSDVLISAADALRRDQLHNEPCESRQPAAPSRPSESTEPPDSTQPIPLDSPHSAHSHFDILIEDQPRNPRPTFSRDYLTPGLSGGAGAGLSGGGGAGAGLSASALELRGERASSPDTTSLNDELTERQTDSSPASPRAGAAHVPLEQMSDPAALDALSVKQLKELLARNRVEYRGCVERRELVERAQRLWRERAAAAARGDDLPLEDSCKICMAAPLECVLLECGHIAACTACSKQLAECPICRQYVVRAVRFFRS